jgi:hypothetical protein
MANDELKGDALHERAAELEIEGRSEMSADELRDAIAEAEAEGEGDGDDLDAAEKVAEENAGLGEGQAAAPIPPEPTVPYEPGTLEERVELLEWVAETRHGISLAQAAQEMGETT